MASSVLVAKSLLCFALLAAVTAAMPARAQTMYRYKDANGVWVYTDRKPAGEQEFQQERAAALGRIAGTLEPTRGEVWHQGRISALLELGAGFDQDLSGRDNIRLAGAFMGLDPATMRRITPTIVEFADIGPFIDAPIKTYSSGMRARLGFAIATAVDPDILLLDEVLATGDETFRAKSKQRVLELVRGAKGVVLVTHDMNWVTEFCNRAILLEQGRIIAEGNPYDVVAIHREHSEQSKAERQAALDRAMKDGAVGSLPPDAARSRLRS